MRTLRLSMAVTVILALLGGMGGMVLAQDTPTDQVGLILIGEEERVLSTLDPQTVSATASEVATYPLPDEIDAPGFEWADGGGEDWPEPVVRSRDWALARVGLAYTLAGAMGEGKAALFDLGYWCFLEAALIAPDEPQHLVNVAFHLNERERFEAALVVLARALELDPDLPGALSNQAYAQAGNGDYDAAIRSLLNELADGIAPVYARERLARYFDLAGFPEAAQSYRDMLAQGYYVPYEPPIDSGAGKELERALTDLLYGVWPGLNAALEEQFPYTVTPWAPDWVMAREERRYYESACRDGTCSRPGGFNTGHYLLSDTYQYHCYQRQPECLPPQRSQEACVRAYCGECLLGAAARWVRYEWSSRSDFIATEMQRLQLARQWYGTLRPEGHALLEAEAAQIPREELRALHVYWDLLVEGAIGGYEGSVNSEVGVPRITLGDLIASRMDLRECASGAAQKAGRKADAAARHDAKLQAWLARQPRGLCRFGICSNWSLPLGPIGIEIDPRTLKVETIDLTLGLKLGKAFSAGFRFGWNLKKDKSVVGLGISVPVAGYSSAGIGIGWSPSSGLEGTVDTGGNLGGPENVHPLKAKTRFFHLAN